VPVVVGVYQSKRGSGVRAFVTEAVVDEEEDEDEEEVEEDEDE
jgi:hypothetical protein